MAGKYALSASFAAVVAALVLVLLIAPPANAARVCTLKGTVLDHGWRTMMLRSGGQCANINVGWRTKFVPNRRPCIGETVAVDFLLEDGYMKATKVVSLTPAPAPAQCYPPPPPSTAECRSVAEKAEEVCPPAKPVCSPKPPPHVADPLWSPSKEKPKPPLTKPEVKKPTKPNDKVVKAPPTEEPTRPPAKEEKKEPVRPEEKGLRTLKGEVVASSPKSLSVRVADEGEAAEVMNIKVGLKTKFIPFRRPATGEKVKVDYREENGDKFGYTVQVIQ